MAAFTITATENKSKYNFGKDRNIEMCVYMITNMVNGRRYVGQSRNKVGKRWASHINSSGSHVSVIKQALQKYGVDSFKFEVLAVADSIKELDYKETMYIQTMSTLYPCGYNLMTGGSNGRVYSVASRAKMKASALARFGKTLSIKDVREALTDEEKETRKRNQLAKMAETKRGQPSKLKGKKISKEHIEKMRASKIGKEVPNKWKQIISSDGVVYTSIKEAVLSIGCNRTTLTKHLNGKLKTLYKKTYSYVVKEV